MNYYNEKDPNAASWIRELIKDKQIPYGDVDERDIKDIASRDIAGYTQCHFFAGIAGWSRALKLAGWPDDRPVWTGSCPCQSFSGARKGKRFEDERHLWPTWFDLIKERRPGVVFGEQVASQGGLEWLDLVWSDMESEDYAFGAVDLCAAGVGAPHIRQRLWFVAEDCGVADTCGDGFKGRLSWRSDSEWETIDGSTGRNGSACRSGQAYSSWGDADWISCRDGNWRPVEPESFTMADGLSGGVVRISDNGSRARMMRIKGYGNAIVPQVAAEFIRSVM